MVNYNDDRPKVWSCVQVKQVVTDNDDRPKAWFCIWKRNMVTYNDDRQKAWPRGHMYYESMWSQITTIVLKRGHKYC